MTLPRDQNYTNFSIYHLLGIKWLQ